MSMDILKAEIQHAQLRHIQEIQFIIDSHVCEPVIQPKKGLFGKKIKFELAKKEPIYQPPMSRGWNYPQNSPPQKPIDRNYILNARKEAFQNITNTAELHTVLRSLESMEQEFMRTQQ